MQKLFKSTYYAGGILLFLVVAVAGLTQTNTFRSYLHDRITEAVAPQLRGELSFGPIKGNLLTGFHVEGLTIIESGHPLLTVERVAVRYEPLGLFVKRLTFSSMSLKNPRISLVRSQDGTWNIGRLLLPSSPGESTPSDWVVAIKNAEFSGAEVTLIDSVKMRDREKVAHPTTILDYPILQLRDVVLRASLRSGPSGLAVNVAKLRFTSPHPEFTLSDANAEFEFTPSSLTVSSFMLETSRSRISGNAGIKNVDFAAVATADELRDKPIDLTLNVERLSFDDLKQFLPEAVGFLDREVVAHVRATGTLAELQVERVVLQTPRSFIRLEGMISNLHRPEDLHLNLVCVDNKLSPDDALVYLAGLNLPDLRPMGELSYDLQFTGTPKKFSVVLNGTSRAGALKVNGSFETLNGDFAYDATVGMHNLNLEALTGNQDLTSRLTGQATVKGVGTDPQTMGARFQAVIDSSEFYRIGLQRTTLDVTLARGTVQSNIQLQAHPLRLTTTSTVRLRPNASPSYLLDATVSGLNLAPMLRDDHFESNLAFQLHADGEGLTLGDFLGTIDATVGRSTFGRHTIDESQFSAVLYGAPEQRSFSLVSDVADIRIEGAFRLDTFLGRLAQGGSLIAQAISHRIRSLDSLRSPTHVEDEPFRSRIALSSQPVDATFDIKVKNLYPLGIFFDERLAGRGEISGTVVGTEAETRVMATMVAESFAYADSSVSMTLAHSRLEFDVGGLSPVDVMESVRTDVAFQADKVYVNALQLDHPRFTVSIRGTEGSLEFATRVDTLVSIALKGKSSYRDGRILYELAQFEAGVAPYIFQNIDPVHVALGRDGIHIDRLWLRHEAEELDVVGFVDPWGESNVDLRLRNLLLSNVYRFSAIPATSRDLQQLGGIVNLKATVAGRLERPRISIEAAAHGVRYRDAVFGLVTFNGTFAQDRMNVGLEFRSKPDVPSLPPDAIVSGSLPYRLSLKSGTIEPVGGALDLSVKSSAFQLEFLDPFLPELRMLTGTMVCDLAIRGTVDAPRYSGFVTVQSARFLFVPLGLQYLVDGQLVPDGERILVGNVTVKNTEQDRSDGRMSVNGNFTLKGLRLKDFDLRSDGQLLVMKESSRQPGQSVYGDLFIGTGSSGIRWNGTPERSFVTGAVMIRSANLILPPTREQLIRSDRTVQITLVDDTLTAPKAREVSDSDDPFSVDPTVLAEQPGTLHVQIQPAQASNGVLANDGSFLDRLVYDLVIETQGLTQVRFIFNPFTGEELFAELKGRMLFAKDREHTRLAGEVEVGDRSYYNFFKKFQASGKLFFTGDALNPELDILARYESIVQSRDTVRSPTEVNAAERPAEQRVVVTLNITGTRNEPKVAMQLERYDPATGRLAVVETGDVQSDAIFFLLTGSFRDELTQQERTSILGTNILYGLTSSVLSGPLTELLRKEIGFISSVDVVYYGGNVQSSTDVRVTGEVGDAVIRLGGRVFSDINNANWSIQVPMSSILGSERWRNLLIEAERRVEGVENFEQRRESNGLRLLYRISF